MRPCDLYPGQGEMVPLLYYYCCRTGGGTAEIRKNAFDLLIIKHSSSRENTATWGGGCIQLERERAVVCLMPSPQAAASWTRVADKYVVFFSSAVSPRITPLKNKLALDAMPERCVVDRRRQNSCSTWKTINSACCLCVVCHVRRGFAGYKHTEEKRGKSACLYDSDSVCTARGRVANILYDTLLR